MATYRSARKLKQAPKSIENRLFETRHGNRLRLKFHPLTEGIGTVAEGVIAISENGLIVGANQAGLSLLNITTADLGVMPIEKLLELPLEELLNWAFSSANSTRLINRTRGGRLFVRIEPGRRPLIIPAQAMLSLSEPNDALSKFDSGDRCMKAAIERARKILNKPIPLLLQGESGVGKELFAAAVHRSSARRDQPFVAVNCAGLPENLIEAELFGYAPGAFTGALREGSVGRIREAHGGTLFLDEIGDMSMPAQAKVLRALQENKITRVGGDKDITVNVRVVAATNNDLKNEIAQNRFREDLYHRLGVVIIKVPPLNERREDIPLLVNRFMHDIAMDYGTKVKTIDEKALAQLQNHQWTGNIRELRNVIERLIIMSGEKIGIEEVEKYL